jgi:predicted DNA-binding transcriptional regulator AlpA
MENIVFTQLSVPEVRQLFRQELESYFSGKEKKNQQPETDHWLNLNDLCAYLPDRPTKPTVYGWVHGRAIPCHKRGKKLYFLKSEIDTWLKAGRKKTYAETAIEAEQYLLTKKGLNNGK